MLFALPPSADAHGLLLESTPRAAERAPRGTSLLELRFNVRVEPRLSRVQLTGPSGARIPLPPDLSSATGPNYLAARLAPLEPGYYTVQWRVLTKDGHVSHGKFSFEIAEEL